MDEHDDDLESEVQEQADEEVSSFPNTGDELTDVADDDSGDERDVPLDKDKAEL